MCVAEVSGLYLWSSALVVGPRHSTHSPWQPSPGTVSRDIRRWSSRRALDPALSLACFLELYSDCLGCPLGGALDRRSARHLALDLGRAADDEADRVSGRDDDGDRHQHTRRFAAAGLDLARPEPPQTLVGHQVAFDLRRQLRRTLAETQQHALGRTAAVDGLEIAHQHDVPDLRRRLARSPYRRQAPALDRIDQLLRDLGTKLTTDLDLLVGLRRLGRRELDDASGPGRDVLGDRGEIVHEDAIGPGDPLTLVILALGDLGRRAAGGEHQGEHTQCNERASLHDWPPRQS